MKGAVLLATLSADLQILQNIVPPVAACDVELVEVDDAGTNVSQGLFDCHEERKERFRSSRFVFLTP